MNQGMRTRLQKRVREAACSIIIEPSRRWLDAFHEQMSMRAQAQVGECLCMMPHDAKTSRHIDQHKHHMRLDLSFYQGKTSSKIPCHRG